MAVHGWCVIALWVTLGAAGPALADVPNLMNYQGFLLDANGLPSNANVAVALGIWADPTSVDPNDRVYEEAHLSVLVNDGVFQVVIGEGDFMNGTLDAGVFTDPDRWLEVSVAGETLSPRQRVAAVAFALQCQEAINAGTLDGLDSSAFATLLHGHAWTELSGIPAGFADDVDDDTQLSEAQVDTFVSNNGFINAEADPEVGLTTSGRFCTGSGATVECTTEFISSAAVQDLTLQDSDISPTADIDPNKVLGRAAQLDFTGTQVFDGGTLRIDAASNRVGVNVDPDEELDVAGDVEVLGNYYWANAKSFSHYISPSQFVASPETSLWILTTGGYRYLNSSGSINARADVNLPDGAQVTAFRCYYYDDNSFNTSFNGVLRRRPLASTDFSTLASVSLGNTGAGFTVRNVFDTTIDDAGVGSFAFEYAINMFWNPSGGSATLRFYGCRVDYTLEFVSSP